MGVGLYAGRLIREYIRYYDSGVMRQNMYSWAVFTGVDLFAFKFHLGRVVPINHSWHQKTRDTGLPNGEDRIRLRSLVLTQYRSVTAGRICHSIYSASKASFAKWCAVKK